MGDAASCNDITSACAKPLVGTCDPASGGGYFIVGEDGTPAADDSFLSGVKPLGPDAGDFENTSPPGVIRLLMIDPGAITKDDGTTEDEIRIQTVNYGELDPTEGSWGRPADDLTRDMANLQQYYYSGQRNAGNYLSENHVLKSTPGASNEEVVFLRCNAGRGTSVGFLGDPQDLINIDANNGGTAYKNRAHCNGQAYDGNCASRNEIQVKYQGAPRSVDGDAEFEYRVESVTDHTIYSSKKLYLGGEIQLSQFIEKVQLPAVYGNCLAEGLPDDDADGANDGTANGSSLQLQLLVTEFVGEDRSGGHAIVAAGDLLNTLQIVYDFSDKNNATHSETDENLVSFVSSSNTRQVLPLAASMVVTTLNADADLGFEACDAVSLDAAWTPDVVTSGFDGTKISKHYLVDLGQVGSEQAINVLSLQRVASAARDNQPHGKVEIRLVATEVSDDTEIVTMVSKRALSVKLPVVPNALNQYEVKDDYRKATEFRGMSVWEDDANGGIMMRVALNTLYYDTDYANPHWKHCVPQAAHKSGMGWVSTGVACDPANGDDDCTGDGEVCNSSNECEKQLELIDYCASFDESEAYGGAPSGGNHNKDALTTCATKTYQVFHNGPYHACESEDEKITEGDRYVSVVHFGQCGEGQLATFAPNIELNDNVGIVAGDFDIDGDDGEITVMGHRDCYASDLLTQFGGGTPQEIYNRIYVAEPADTYVEVVGTDLMAVNTRYPEAYGYWTNTVSSNAKCKNLVDGDGAVIGAITSKTMAEVCDARSGYYVDGFDMACANEAGGHACRGDENSRMFYQGVEYAAEVNLDVLTQNCRATSKRSSGRGEDTYRFSVAHTLLKPDVRGGNYLVEDSDDYFRSECVQSDYMVAVNTKLRAQLSAEFGNNIDVMVVRASLEQCDGSNVEGADVDRFANGLNDGCTNEDECVDGAYRLSVDVQIDNLVLNNAVSASIDNFKYVGIRSANNDLKSRGSIDREDLDGMGYSSAGVLSCPTLRDTAVAPLSEYAAIDCPVDDVACSLACKAGPLSESTYERMMASTSAYGFGDEVRGSNQATSTMRLINMNRLSAGMTGDPDSERTDEYVRQTVTLTTGCFEVMNVNNGPDAADQCDADLFHTRKQPVQHSRAAYDCEQHADGSDEKLHCQAAFSTYLLQSNSNYDLDVRFHACTTENCLAGGKWTVEGGATEAVAALCNQLCHERRGAPGTQLQQGGQGSAEGAAFYPLAIDLRHTECPENFVAAEENLHAQSQIQLYPGIEHPRAADSGIAWGLSGRDFFEPYSKTDEKSDIEFGPAQTIVATLEADDDWVVNSRTVWIRRARLCLVNEAGDNTDADTDQDRTKQGCDNVGTAEGQVKDENTYLLVEEGKRYSYEDIYGRDYFHVTACKSMELMTNSGGTPQLRTSIEGGVTPTWTEQINVNAEHKWRYGLGFDTQTATTHVHRLCGVTDDGLESAYWGLDNADENEEEVAWKEQGCGAGGVSSTFQSKGRSDTLTSTLASCARVASDGGTSQRPTGYSCHWDGLRAGNMDSGSASVGGSDDATYKKNAWDALAFSSDYLVELVNKDADTALEGVATQTWLLDIEGEMVDCRSTLDPSKSGSNEPKSTPMLRAPDRKLRSVTVHTFDSTNDAAMESSLGFRVKNTRDATDAPATDAPATDAPATDAPAPADNRVAVGYEYATIVLSITTFIGLVYLIGKCVRHANNNDFTKANAITTVMDPMQQQFSLLVPRRMIKPRV